MEVMDLIETQYDWLGSIPKGWRKVSLKYLFNIQKGRKPSIDYDEFEEGLLPYLSMEVLRGKTDSPVYANPLEDKALVLVNEGDILILWDGSKAGEFVPGTKGALSSTMARLSLTNQEIDNAFLLYYLKNSEGHVQNNTIGMGIPHVDGDVLRNLPIFLPSLPEQKQIARFLDHQTGIIDALIEKKEALIEKLKEQRQAVINEAVTKGLNLNAPLKDSGIPWLGEIPEHWEVKKIKYLGEFQNGVSAGASYFGEGTPFVSYSDVYKNEILPTSVEGLAKSTEGDQENYSVQKGDVFFTRTSETIEEIGIASTCFQDIEKAVFAGFLIRFRPVKNKLTIDFSRYFFRCFIPRIFFEKEMNLVTRASLSQELLKRLPVLLPTIVEQEAITEYLNSQTKNIDTALKGLKTQIQKLQEYRQSIISEAVTGKIDVREWEPKN